MENKTLLYWNSFKKNIEEVAFNKVLDLNLLYGLDQQKDLIQKNTKNFIDGFSYNHALLWGVRGCLLYTSPSPRDVEESRMPSSA